MKILNVLFPVLMFAFIHVQPSSCASYKILMIFPFGSKSHRNVFMPLATALLDRGHKIWMLSPFGPTYTHPNFTEINHGLPGMSDQPLDIFSMRTNLEGWRSFFSSNLVSLAREMYKKDNVMEIYERKKEFDVVIFAELFAEPAFAFLEGKTSICLATSGITAMFSEKIGNILPFSYRRSFGFDFPRPYSFVSRFVNFFERLIESYLWSFLLNLENVEQEIKTQFPEFSSFETLHRNASLVLSNTHFTIDFPYPTLPNQVEIGGMHCRPKKTLPKDLSEWLNNSNDTGVVYFSMGSIVQSSTLPKEFRNIFVEAFERINLKVLWKYEGEDIPGISPNVLIKKWIPQQDVLAHPNVKVFITHSGLLSTQEAIYHGTPMVALPIFADQFRNSIMVAHKKFGVALDWDTLTVNKVVDAIEEIVNNSVYENQITKCSERFRDRPFSASETAVWWIEYVVRNNGAPSMTSPAKQLSAREYYNLDVILLFYFIFIFSYIILRKLFVICQFSLFESSQEQFIRES